MTFATKVVQLIRPLKSIHFLTQSVQLKIKCCINFFPLCFPVLHFCHIQFPELIFIPWYSKHLFAHTSTDRAKDIYFYQLKVKINIGSGSVWLVANSLLPVFFCI